MERSEVGRIEASLTHRQESVMLRPVLTILSIASFIGSAAPAQTTTRVSVDSSGAQGNNYSGTYGDAISADGRFVAFGSGATNLVAGGSPLQWEIFRHDNATGATALVSVDAAGTPGPAGSFYPSISADGSVVAFESDSGFGTGDSNGRTDIFVHDFTNGVTALMSLSPNGTQWADACHNAAISGDGRFVAFHKLHPTTMYHFRTDVYVRDRVAGTTAVVNVNTSGVQTGGTYSSDPSISFDGRYIAFASTATDLVSGDTNASYDIFVRDMQLGATVRASVDSLGNQGNDDSLDPSISSDGRFVAFSSTATNLVPGDVNGHADVFVHDLVSGATVLASVDSNGAQANADCLNPSLSADGRFVSFHSTASNLVPGDTNNVDDVFVRDLLLGTTTCASIGLANAPANGASDRASISADGRFISFVSFASNLVAGDTNGTYDVFVRDRGRASAFAPLCFGDGTAGACPCSNAGAAGNGCENSAATGGALLTASGVASLAADAVQLHASGELPTALSIVLQGSSVVAPTTFGDGLRCAGGALKRLYVEHASGGAIGAPQSGDPSVSARSAALGDTIPLGATRIYQVYYRDSNLAFCAGGFNATNAIAIAWGS
jgi:Tol biopolymer transport system component